MPTVSPVPTDSPTPAPSAAPAATPTPTPPPPPPAQVDCRLVVPVNPLTAQGLATPWQLTADDTGPCHEANLNQSAFVQAAVLNRGTGQISVYNPLVIDQGSTPAIAPTLPTLPANAIVGIWVGFNGNNLTLVGPGSAACVNGADGSNFGQDAFCNATAFFAAGRRAVRAGKLRVPALGTARDGQPCPTTRDFSVVDQDPSDNTTTVYLATADGRLAQDTPQNEAQLQGAQAARNGSDEGLLNRALDAALGCTPWTAPDLADPTGALRSTAWPLTEIMAAVRQAPPVALVPAGDPMVIAGTTPDLAKLNAYRAGVDQPQVASLAGADTAAYCRHLLGTGLVRLAADRALTSAAPSPFPDQASNLFNFLAMRFAQTFSDGDGFLHCQTLLGLQAPVTLAMTGDVVTGATIDLHPPRTGGSYENGD